MLEQIETDRILGKKFCNVNMRKKNIQDIGPDAPGLDVYRKLC